MKAVIKICGNIVEHENIEIIKIENNMTTIKFEDGGEETFSMNEILFIG